MSRNEVSADTTESVGGRDRHNVIASMLPPRCAGLPCPEPSEQYRSGRSAPSARSQHPEPDLVSVMNLDDHGRDWDRVCQWCVGLWDRKLREQGDDE